MSVKIKNPVNIVSAGVGGGDVEESLYILPEHGEVRLVSFYSSSFPRLCVGPMRANREAPYFFSEDERQVACSETTQ